MSLPVHARVIAAQSFAENLRSAHGFLRQQDAGSAAARYRTLLERLQEARGHLSGNPAIGRPARFLQAQSVQALARAAQAKALAAAQGTPLLREWVLKPYVLLYAHSHDRVVLLALKHERELEFRFSP